MKRNMSNVDRLVRAVLAIVLFAVGLILGGFWGDLMIIVAGIFVVTALFAICPLYMLFGIDTCKMSKTCPD